MSGRTSRTERIIHLGVALVVAALCALSGINDPLDEVIWATEARLSSRQASGDIAFVGAPADVLSPQASRQRRDVAQALDVLDRQGVDHVYLDLVFDRAGNPDDDAVLARSIAQLGPRITLVNRIVTKSGDRDTVRASIPAVAGRAQTATSVRPLGILGMTWHMDYRLVGREGKSLSLPVLMAGTVPPAEGSFDIDYGIDFGSIPNSEIESLIAPGTGAEAAAQFKGKSVIIGVNDISSFYRAAIPGYSAVPPSYVSIFAAETLKRGVVMRVDWWAVLLTVAVTVLVTGLVARTRRNRVYAGLAIFAALTASMWLFSNRGSLASLGTAIIFMLVYAGLRYWSYKRHQQATQDLLTGLPNFAALAEALAGVADRGERAIIVAKIHRYEEVLSSLPPERHADYAGQIAQRLRVTDPDMQIYRDGGKYYAWSVAAPEIEGLESHLRGLRAIFSQPLRVGGDVVDVGITFGVDATNDDNPARKIATATAAADETNEALRPISFFQGASIEQRRWNVSLQAKIDAALEQRHIYPVYQPQCSLLTGEVVGAEALVRWRDPERGEILPEYFIEQCEQAGRMALLTQRVLEEAIEGATTIARTGRPIMISVNVSAILMTDHGLPEMITAAAARCSFDLRHLVIEVTETAKIADYTVAAEVMQRLRSMGVRLSIDDFGVGAASFETLLRLPFDEIKIDKLFVSRMKTSEKAKNIVLLLVELGKREGLTVVAEGVEDAESLAMLKRFGCDVAQGYYLSRPVPLQDFMLFQELAMERNAISG